MSYTHENTVDVVGFPITGETCLTGSGDHFDIGYSVTNHGRYRNPEYGIDRARGTWCYYVHVSEMSLPAEAFEEFWLPKSDGKSWCKRGKWEFASYDYYGPRWSSVEWHGGVTWYSKEAGFDGDPRQVKIGCDFAHSWDEGRWYDYERVAREAKQTIDELRAIYPFYRKCQYSGVWLPEAELVAKDGKLYTPQAIEDMRKWAEERAAEKAAT